MNKTGAMRPKAALSLGFSVIASLLLGACSGSQSDMDEQLAAAQAAAVRAETAQAAAEKAVASVKGDTQTAMADDSADAAVDNEDPEEDGDPNRFDNEVVAPPPPPGPSADQ